MHVVLGASTCRRKLSGVVTAPFLILSAQALRRRHRAWRPYSTGLCWRRVHLQARCMVLAYHGGQDWLSLSRRREKRNYSLHFLCLGGGGGGAGKRGRFCMQKASLFAR